MRYIVHSHRHGQDLVADTAPDLWGEIHDTITGITDDALMAQYPISGNRMSLSSAINDLFREGLAKEGWTKEAPIFQDSDYLGSDAKMWRLDFAKQDISIEVAFNHGEAMAWNLIKPVLASELNHVKKAIQTRIGVIILATEDLKTKGAFDSAVGTYEKALRYLKPLNTLLTVPLVVIGLQGPESFKVVKQKIDNKNVGEIVKL